MKRLNNFLLVVLLVLFSYLNGKAQDSNSISQTEAMNHGLDLIESGRNQEAIALFTEVINQFPSYSMAYACRSQAKVNIENIPSAYSDINIAISLDDKDFKNFSQRGMIYLRIKNYNSALEDFNRAISLNSQHGNSFFGRGFAKDHLGDKNGAYQDLQKAKSLGSSSAIYYIDNVLFK